MLIVGYDNVNKWWLIKNSWGVGWGINKGVSTVSLFFSRKPVMMQTSLTSLLLTPLPFLPTLSCCFLMLQGPITGQGGFAKVIMNGRTAGACGLAAQNFWPNPDGAFPPSWNTVAQFPALL